MINKSLSSYLLTLALVVSAVQLHAETAEEKGLAIAKEADRRDTGFVDQTANLTMELRNKQGDSSIRYIHIKTLEVIGDGDKSLSIFEKPADVSGTAFLSFSHAQKPDEQWLYLPALKRVKRINSNNKSGPFMGSEFAYEDLASQEIEKYTYKYIKDETVNGVDSFVVERIPTYEHSGYTRQRAWINKAEYRPEKIEFYDRKDSLLKTLNYSGYQQYLNQFWRPEKMTMENHQTEKSTVLTWSHYAFKTGLDERDFSQNALKRAR